MRNNYRQSFDRVAAYIYAHLEDDLDLDRLADVACLSSYHWHRVYAAVQGETVMATVRRLRLQRAADRLANSDLPVKEVAARAAFGSVAAFSRAFKQAYGQTPAAYRQGGSHNQYKQAHADGDATGFEVHVVERPAQRCAAVAHTGSYLQIDQAMGVLFASLSGADTSCDMTADTQMLAVFLDDPQLVDEAQLRAFACTPIMQSATVPAPLEELQLAAGTYVRLTYQGPYADMRGAYQWLYGTWLPNSEWVPAEHPGYEAYMNSPVEVAPAALLTHIHVPVVKGSVG